MNQYKNLYTYSLRTTQWYTRHINDHYVKESKRLNYRSRAAFKLIQLNEKYKLMKQNSLVLDLGSAPGGWSQISSQLTQSNNQKINVISVDLETQQHIEGVQHLCGDINSVDIKQKIKNIIGDNKFDCVLSDMSPNFSGVNYDDHDKFKQLNNLTLALCIKFLKKDGKMAIKSIVSLEEKDQFLTFQKFFRQFSREKPGSSRSESSEIYHVGEGFWGNEKNQNLNELITNKNYQQLITKFEHKSIIKSIILDFECL